MGSNVLDPALYPHEATMPAPHGGLGRQYRYRFVEQPQGGRRTEAIFLSTFGGSGHWREVRRSETLDALAALPLDGFLTPVGNRWCAAHAREHGRSFACPSYSREIIDMIKAEEELCDMAPLPAGVPGNGTSEVLAPFSRSRRHER